MRILCVATEAKRKGLDLLLEAMEATIDHHVVADSDDLVELAGYQYFPESAVQTDWLTPAPKNESDLRCPHGVQFYDVTIGGVRHERAAWRYEAPQPQLQQVAGRFGFWNDVKVG